MAASTTSARAVVPLRSLRDAPTWKLLAAHNAPVLVPLLKKLLLDTEKTLPVSVFVERLTHELDLLRAAGEDWPRDPGPYLREWLEAGYLVRRLPPGTSEETVELSAEAAQAIRFVLGLQSPRSATTESRLSTVITQLVRLAEDTDENASTRMKALLAERERIDTELDRLRRGEVKVLAPDRALERAREVLALAGELTDDFRRVRAEFERLHRTLRESLLQDETSRGAVLGRLFAGYDLLVESDAGQSFEAFWRLLTDPEQSSRLEEALLAITTRPFASTLSTTERRFLTSLMRQLMSESTSVNETVQSFATSLKRFVQSREYLETRRLTTLIREAERKAYEARTVVHPATRMEFSIDLTSAAIGSPAQWVLDDPAERLGVTRMQDAESSPTDLVDIADYVHRAEIDFRSLRANVVAALADRVQASIGDLIRDYPATQGLGSIVGYMVLAERAAEPTGDREIVSWVGQDHVERRARIPTLVFVRSRLAVLQETLL